MKRSLLTLALAAVLVAAANPALAEPDPEVPVTLSVELKTPGRYWFKYALFDRDGSDALDPGTEVWSEQMDTLGKRRRIGSRRLKHMLGSIASPNGPLNPADFSQQLWVQAFRWRNAAWQPCSDRVKLLVQPYALYSSQAGGAGAVAADSVTSATIVDGSVTGADLGTETVTGSNIQDGSVAAGDLQDGAALAEILDNDGAGSGLDADTVDGLHANAFVPASSGNAVISGDYTFSGTQTGFLNIPATSLVGEAIVRHVGFGEAYLRTGNTQAWASQAVHLPHGATLTELRCWLRDNDAGYITVSLDRNTGPTTVTMASISTNGLPEDPATAQIADSSIVNPVINRYNYAYTLVVYLTGTENTPNLSVNNCRLTYTVTKLAP